MSRRVWKFLSLGKSINKIISLEDIDTFVGRNDFDLNSSSSIYSYFKSNRFDVIINCVAYTAVDKAESEPDLANQINHLAPKKIAEIAKQHGTKLIHISTDYVFDGVNHKPYIESDTTNPKNIYGETKLAGEKVIQGSMTTGAIIIRTGCLYSEYGNNFVKTMLNLGKNNKEVRVIFDQIGAPTYASDLAQAVIEIIKGGYLHN